MKHPKIILTILISIYSFLLFGKDNLRIDSLWKDVKQAKHDTIRVQAYIEIGDEYENFSSDTATIYYSKAIEIAENAINSLSTLKLGTRNIEYKLLFLKASTYKKLGILQKNLGRYDKALDYLNKSLSEYNKLPGPTIEKKSKSGISDCYSFIGIVYKNQGVYRKALDYYLKSLQIDEELGDKGGISRSYINIGYIHYYQNSYEKAIEYYLKSLKIKEDLGDKQGISTCYFNIANVMDDQKKYTKALEYYHKSLTIDEEQKDRKGMSYCYNNIGFVHKNMGEYDTAISFYMKSLTIKEELGDKYGIANVYNNLGAITIKLSDSVTLSENQRIELLNKSIEYGLLEYKLAIEIGAIYLKNGASSVLEEAYTKLGNLAYSKGKPILAADAFKNAIKYVEVYKETKDSLFSKEKTNALTDMNVKYQTEKKEILINNLEKEKKINDERTRRQKTFNVALLVGIILLCGIVLLVYINYIQKKKANNILKQQKIEIEQKNINLFSQKNEIQIKNEEISSQRDLLIVTNEELGKKNTQITDSINYARLIQEAILPSKENLSRDFEEYFTFFKPKDIVSGDFYWSVKVEDNIYFAAVDCTGHGVPGAFMSMIGNTLLNDIVKSNKAENPSDILEKLHNGVVESLKQGSTADDQQDDGMDIALCSWNNKSKILKYSGAHNPLFLIRDGKLIEYKADVRSIGSSYIKKFKKFNQKNIDINKGDMIYIFTDGFLDQFGGENFRKYYYKPFQNFLLTISVHSMEKQKELLREEFNSWKGNYKQIDDVLVFGVKF